MTGAIDVEQLLYAYGAEPVLNGLTFSVPEGVFFIVIGPNGSGKTTLMKVISGLEKPSGGRVRIWGRSMTRYARRTLAQKIAYVPQTPPQNRVDTNQLVLHYCISQNTRGKQTANVAHR